MAPVFRCEDLADLSIEPYGRIPSFRTTLAAHGMTLTRAKTTTLQVSVVFLYNQTCTHCHLDAGPGFT